MGDIILNYHQLYQWDIHILSGNDCCIVVDNGPLSSLLYLKDADFPRRDCSNKPEGNMKPSNSENCDSVSVTPRIGNMSIT